MHDYLVSRLWNAVASATWQGAPVNFVPTQWGLPWQSGPTTVAIVSAPYIDLAALWQNLSGFVNQLEYRWTRGEGGPTLVIDGAADHPVKLIVKFD